MKKYLFLLVSILSIFFVSDRVDALSMSVNSTEVEVTEENLIYYIYSQYPDEFEKYSNYFLFKTASSYKIYFTDSTVIYNLGSFYIGYNPTTYSYCLYVFNSSFEKTSNSCKESVTSRTKVSNYANDTLLFANTLENSHSSVTASNIIIKQDLIDYFGTKAIYTITYYLNDEVYQTVEVKEGSSYELLEYSPQENYSFSGWTYDDSIDLTNITSDFSIYGTTSYNRPNLNYSENIDSVIHELSVSIIGKNVPVEFDYVYTIMDYIILIVLVLCVIAPFVIIIKLLSGRW